MIADTEYTAALTELSNYLAAFPQELDFVQKRIDKIVKAREQYLVLANQLIDVMESEPENAQKKLEIIARLESVEKRPTEEQLQFIKQAKIASQFTYYRSQFRKLLEESQTKVKNGEYSQAVSNIQKGFDMYRQEFYDENSKDVTDKVTTTVNKLNAECKEYGSMQDKLHNSYTALLNAIKAANYREAASAYKNFNKEMELFATLRNQVLNDANSLKTTFNSLQKKNPELTEASYLPFIFKFTLGLDSLDNSGIIGAMDAQYINYIESLKPEIFTAISNIKFENIDSTVLDSIKTSDLPLLKWQSISDFCNLGQNLNSMYSLVQFNRKQNYFDKEYVAALEYGKTISTQINNSYKIVERYQTINETLKTIERPENPVEGIRSKNSYANKMLDCAKQYDECALQASNLLNAKWFTEPNIQANEIKFEKLNNYYSKLNKSLLEVCSAQSKIQWKNTAIYFAEAAAKINSFYQTEYSKASDFLQKHYPKEASELAAKTEKELNSDVEILVQCRQTLLKNTSDKSTIFEEEKTVSESVSKMKNLKTQGEQLIKKSKEEILLSQRAFNEAELRYNQALQAFKRGDYSSSRRNIELSSLKYTESLEHQESDSIRKEADAKLLALGQQINDAENKIVIAEVRQLKTKAKSEYYNGNFEKAESLLAQAKSRWAVTNGDEEDEEIANLYALVETALSMKTGRVIPPTAPLYPEMSQILSIAHQYFNTGSKKIKNGKYNEGKELLVQAKQKLQEVQLVYPLNQEASLLTLKIDQLIDPDSFNEMFEQKVNAAKSNYKIASRAKQALADLTDLYEIRPDYPGLKNLIQQVKIELGIIPKPVDNSALVKSQNLFKEADAIVKNAGSNEAKLRSALVKLDEAIKLNSDNEKAIALKDRIQSLIGGRAPIVLSSADEAKYLQAINEFNNYNVETAAELVNELLKNPNNRFSKKILDLKKKIEAIR